MSKSKSLDKLFDGRHFDREIILLCVRWYLPYKLSLLPADTEIRSSKYLNTLIEQDHRNIKSRTKVMLGFRRFTSATTTIAGIELMHRIRKGQFNLATLDLQDTATPAVWNAVASGQ
ncbi:DDE-type integrase/transposase/recombinase [Paraburkholderia sp. 5N]|uniref:DDE-type integrase/transposase/recombinase n=1 Tax=Paraburkholderia elongata TaxID=2675747 RepID=A0A972SLI0_9BURK|nr:DDE-type integrase/transposase/recombinase [Paraburkholderia elongata]